MIRLLRYGLLGALLLLITSSTLFARGSERPARGGRAKVDIDRLLDEWGKLSTAEKREKFRLYEERWMKLPPQERTRRLRIFEERLKGRSPEEVSELLRRLKHLKKRSDLQALRERQRRMKEVVRSVLAAGDDGLKMQVRRLPPHHRNVVERFAVSRLYDVARKDMASRLTEEERKHLASLEPKSRRGILKAMAIRKILSALPKAELEEIQGLPEREKRTRIEAAFRRAQAKLMGNAREQVAGELMELLRKGPAELDRRARSQRIRKLLQELDVQDPSIANTLVRMPYSRLRVVLDQLRRAGSAEEKQQILHRLKAKRPR